ncbi:MAG: 30S ribosomal protein S17 [Actinomycetota bacterium]
MSENQGTETAVEVRPNARKVREGIVVSTKMDKTVVVKVVDRVRHPRYRKTLQRTSKFYAHDETNDAREGDRVRIQETRPLSKLKRWRILEIVERAR